MFKKNHKIFFWFLLGIVLAIALGLRIYKLTAENFWGDELFSASWVARLTLLDLLLLRINPLYEMILRVLSFGGRFNSEILFRSWSVFCGLIGVIWMYRIGKRLRGPGLGIAAALLLALCPFHIFYSQEVRYYAQVVAMALITCDCCLLWLDTRKWRWIICAGIFAASTVLTHPYGGVILPGLVIFVSIDFLRTARNKVKLVLRDIAQIAVAACICVLLLTPILHRWDPETGTLKWQELSSAQYKLQTQKELYLNEI